MVVTKCCYTGVMVIVTRLYTHPNTAGSRSIGVVDPAIRRPGRVSVDGVGHLWLRVYTGSSVSTTA